MNISYLTCDVSTRLVRDDVSSSDFAFHVECTAEPSPENGHERRAVGLLSGFTFFPGRLTGSADLDALFDLCDARSGHLVDGYTLLRKRQIAVARAVSQPTLESFRGVVFCERMVVHPALRGQRLGLRLLREVSHMFSSAGGLMMLNAAPDARSGEAANSAFSRYLLSDASLGLGAVKSPAFPGWLAGPCRSHRADDRDTSLVTLAVTGNLIAAGGLSLP